jgi:NOL1/NOP2/sun family putative RNA methylase
MSISFPENFKKHIQDSDLNWDDFVESHNQEIPVSVRINSSKTNDNLHANDAVSWNEKGIYLNQRPDFTLDPLFHAGTYYVQEASSMSIETVLEQCLEKENNPVILDLCAAPGGKSTLIADWLDNQGLLVSNEVIKSRAGVLSENLTRWGAVNTVVSSNDPFQLGKLNGFFDCILVDAPCSGSGMFRKDPNAVKHWSEQAVVHCAARQERIIQDIWPALKPNGILIYSTCSYSEAENENIAKFIMQEYDAEPLSIQKLNEIDVILKSEVGYRFYPHLIKGEGFYLAVFRKNPSHKLTKLDQVKIDVKKTNPFSELISSPIAIKLMASHLKNSLVSETMLPHLYTLFKYLHILKCGVNPGEEKGKNIIPDHELALSNVVNPDLSSIHLDLHLALRFLKKEALPNTFNANGWNLMKYEGISLGWGNALPNRINNGLPKSWRILKEID